MAVIDLSNYATLLNQTTTGGRAGTPNGNIFFDTANDRIELITVEEQATVIITDTSHPSYTDGTTPIPNPFSEQDGVKLEALYAFERQERRKDENLRKHDFYFKGTFKFGGAYELVNGRKFDDANGSATSATTDDRFKCRSSGWIERDVANAIGRIYYGNASLGNIEAASAPYYQLVNGGAPTSYHKVGPIDEAVQVFGDTGVDANSPLNADLTTYLALSVRTYGQNFDRKLLADSGVTKMDGYYSGFALGESVHLSTNTVSHPLADVYNATPASQVGVWQNMTLEELDTPQVETGFNESNGNFSWVLNNPNGASLVECLAYLDAIAQTDDDINAHVSNVTNGQRVGTWYSYNAAGKVLPQVGTGTGEGLFIEGLLGTDRTSVIFSDDAAATKTYPNYLSVGINVGAGAVSDTNAWFHCFFDVVGGNDFNTATAITVQDTAPVDVKGTVSGHPYLAGSTLTFLFDYNTETLGGTADTDKDIVIECEGDGGVTAAKTILTLTDPDVAATVTASCVPPAETNV